MTVALTLACVAAVPLAAQKKQTSLRTGKGRVVPREVRSLQAQTAAGATRTPGSQDQETFRSRDRAANLQTADAAPRVPREHRLRRADSFDGDLRGLPQTGPRRFERPEREGPDPNPVLVDVDRNAASAAAAPPRSATTAGAAPAPAPAASFEGLDFNTYGNGHPPDTNGDVGPAYFIQSINTSLGIFDKATGALVTAFSFNTFMSQGHFGNLCDTNNFGDPVVMYDTFEDRWVVTDFAFSLVAGAVSFPPGAFQCFAVSKSGDPIAGGWNFYSIDTPGGLGDYPKFGIWPDGIYMAANMFGYTAGAPFQNARVFAFNKAQMYAGLPAVQVVSFDAPANDFTLLPSNARLQTGTPPPGTPNYFLSTWRFLNALTVYKFHVDWNRISLSTFTGPDIPIAATSWPNAGVPSAPSLGGNSLDVLQIRAMMQNQYSNIEGAESLWATHTVRRGDTTGFAAPRWYQLNVTGGVVAANTVQATTWDPDGANVMHRFIPSVAVDRQGDMALGYSTSSATTKPAIKYAGRLASDPIETFSQTEQTLIQGAGTQSGNCGSGPCTRWGDYSAMTLDPDGCTFWYTNLYYAVDGLNHHTRIGSFAFPGCAPAANGSLQGTVRTTTGSPLAGATIALGQRTATTDASGFYLFSDLPAGTYPSIAASLAGYASQMAASIDVPAGAAAVQDFTLAAQPLTACFVDTTQSDFQLGLGTNCDLGTSVGDVLLVRPEIEQQLNNSSSGIGITTTQWLGQTFVAGATGALTRLDLSLFCAVCSGANPAITVEIRSAAGGVPTSTVLASTTVPGFSSGAAAFYTATFASPAALTAGTQYAYTLHLATARTGTYAGIFSTTAAAYPNGDRVLSTNSGATWFLPTSSGTVRDLTFRAFIDGYPPSGALVSSLKDANPAPAATPTWLSIGWTAATPAGTSVRFQAAASNSPAGPFTFAGPDGTAATFFANGDSLAQFNGNRYLKYRALLETTTGGATPTLSDVTICYQDVRTATALAVDPATGPYNGSAALAATLTAGGAGISGRTIAFALNGASVGTAVTNAAGTATLPLVSLAGISGGVYPGGVTASFAGDLGYTSATAANVLTITRLSQTIAFDPLPDRTATDAPFTLTAAGGDSGNPIVFSTSSIACSVSGSDVTLFAAGPCAIDANQAGNDNYDAAPTVTQSFAIGFASQTIVFPAIAARTYGAADFTPPVSATSGLAVALAAAGQCTVSGGSVHLTAAGSCSVTASQDGDSRYAPAAAVTQTFTIGAATLVVTADDKVKLLNAALPALTGTLTGVVAGDNITATFSTPASAFSPIGSYPIVPSLVDPNNRLSNYSVTRTNGVLSIVYAPPGNCVGGPGHQILPPINPDGSSVFRANGKIDVAFRVCDARGIPIWWTDVVRSFTLVKIERDGHATDVSVDLEGAFRFDVEDLAWVFHLNTKVLGGEGTYSFRIALNDGSAIGFSFTLKKNGG